MGDTHPAVSVEDGHFVVTFVRSNFPEEHIYETHYRPDGTAMTEPYPVPKRRSYDPTALIRDLTGFKAKTGPVRVELVHDPDNRTFHLEAHYRTGRLISRPLTVDGLDVTFLHDVVVDGRVLVFLATLKDEKRVRLCRVDPTHPEKDDCHSVGVPARIYWFPAISSILTHGHRHLVAWIRHCSQGDDPAAECGHFELMLTTWDLKSSTASSEVIAAAKSWNTRVDAAIVGDDLLVVFHEPQRGHHSDSKIRVVHKKLD